MEATIQSHQRNVSTRNENVANIKSKAESVLNFWKNAEQNRFGIILIVLSIVGCLGGVAAAYGIMDSWVKLAAVAFPATISLAMVLSVAPMRIIFIVTSIALLMDILVLIF